MPDSYLPISSLYGMRFGIPRRDDPERVVDGGDRAEQQLTTTIPGKHDAPPRRKRRLKGEGVEQRIRDYFQANPDEELSRSDAATKFGCHENNLDKVLRKLREEGLVESVSVFRLKARQ